MSLAVHHILNAMQNCTYKQNDEYPYIGHYSVVTSVDYIDYMDIYAKWLYHVSMKDKCLLCIIIRK